MEVDERRGITVQSLIKTGTKHDKGKADWTLLPWEAIEEVVAVLGVGAEKYEKWNWCKGFAYTRLGAAALRHIISWLRGEDRDPETGLSHLAHAICCLLFLLSFTKTGAGSDDRRKV